MERNKTFAEWIQGQDEANWGLDGATITMVTDFFHYREICDNDRMGLYFWRDINMYRQRYKDQIRLESANSSMDPLVSRYFEAEYRAEKSGESTLNKSESGTSTNKNQGQLIYSGPETVTESWNEDARGSQEENIEDRDKIKEISRNGSRILHRVGDASGNFTRDAEGSGETSTRTTQDSGNATKIINTSQSDDSADATKERTANKTAPQSAVNLPRQQVIGSDPAAEMRNNALGAFDFSYASGYQETDTETGHSGSSSGKSTETTQSGNNGTVTDNKTFSRNQQTGTDITETETFDGFSERTMDSGTEYREKIYNDGKTGGKSTTTTKSNQQTNDTGSGSHESTGSQTGSSTDRELNRNRYTGREGLTPQAGLESALRYLQTMPQAIRWLIDKLEHNFIGVYDL